VEDVMRRTFLMVVVVSLVFLSVSGLRGALIPSQESRSASSPKPAGGRNPLIGTWKLVSPNAVGVMMYDPAGYMGLAVMQSGRQKYAGSEPTPAEAKSAFESFRSFFGTYAIDETAGSVTVHIDGSLDPNLTGSDYQSAFDLSGARLTLKPRPTATGRQDILVWERMPDQEHLTPTHRRLIGFWKLVPNEGEKAQAAPSNQDQRRGFIIYTAAGQMAVHIMPGGRTRYAGREPTPEEAKVALRSYTTYFGPYTVNEQDRYIVHQRIAHTIPASIGTNGQRFYEFSGKRLVLRVLSTTFTVPTTLQAAKTEGREPSMITWERISADVGSR
jgi:hypothetical protein